MDTFLRIHKKVRDNYLKEHLKQATFKASQHIKIKGFDLKLPL